MRGISLTSAWSIRLSFEYESLVVSIIKSGFFISSQFSDLCKPKLIPLKSISGLILPIISSNAFALFLDLSASKKRNPLL